MRDLGNFVAFLGLILFYGGAAWGLFISPFPFFLKVILSGVGLFVLGGILANAEK